MVSIISLPPARAGFGVSKNQGQGPASVALALSAGCALGQATMARLFDTPPDRATVTPRTPPAETLAILDTLAVKGRAPKSGYSREQFGPAWADVDRNGCDTRNDILRRDLTAITLKPGTNGCVVLSGHLADQYT